jgi:hypothetical protein
MRGLLLSILLLFSFNNLFSQSYSYSYVDPCTGKVKSLDIPTVGNPITVNYYGEVSQFNANDFNNGNFAAWINNIAAVNSNKPCGEVVTLLTTNINMLVTQNIVSTVMNVTSIANMAQSMSGMADGLGNSVNNSEDGGKSGSKKDKKDGKNNNGNNSSSSTPDNNNNSSGQPNSTTNGQGQGSQINSNNGNGSQSTGSNGTPSGNGSSTNGNGNSQGSSNGNGQTNSSGSGQGSGSVGNNSGSSNPPSGNPPSGTPGSNGNQTNGGSGSSTGTPEPNNPGTPGSSGTSSSGSSSSGSSSGSGSSSSGAGNSNGAGSGGTTTSSGSGSNGTGSTPPNGQENSTTTKSSGGGSTNGISNSISNSEDNSGNGGNGNKGGSRTRTGSIIGTGDIVALKSAEDANAKNQFKFTASLTHANTKSTKVSGLLLNYTTEIKNMNITLYKAWVIPKSQWTIIAANSSMLNFERDFFNTTTTLASKRFKGGWKKLTVMSGLNYTMGNLGDTKFGNLSAVGGGFYSYNIGKSKKLSGSILCLAVYSPFTQFFEGQWWESGTLLVPFNSWDYSITKKFKFNISISGVYQVNQNMLNYQVLTGGKMML